MKKRIINFTLMIVLVFSQVMPSMAAYSVSNPFQVSGTKRCTLTGLKHGLAVQNFYITSNYIYITQRKDSTTYVSRCSLSGEYLNEMELQNCGHGQTLEVYTYNNKTYLLVGCASSSSTSYYWSTNIGRIEYKAGDTVNSSSINRFTNLIKVNNNSSKCSGTVKRVAAAISQGNDRMIFRVQDTSNNVAFGIYDFSDLNALLDKNTTVDMGSASAEAARVSTLVQKSGSVVLPNDSFQGIELTGTSTIYLSGGGEGQTPKIVRMTSSGTKVSEASITNVGTKEIEGICVKTDGNIYYLIVDANNKKNGQIIYYFPTSKFNY